MIKENTHEVLISSEEAEQLLHRLENSSIGKKVSEAKTGHSNYLLTGILTTPDGELWMGDRQQHYRTKPKRDKKSRWLNMSIVDTALTLTARRKSLEVQIERLERENSVQKVLASLSESDMARTLKTLVKTFEEMPSKRWKELIKTLVKQIVLDPETLDCCIYYSIPVENRICMASPRGVEPLLPP